MGEGVAGVLGTEVVGTVAGIGIAKLVAEEAAALSVGVTLYNNIIVNGKGSCHWWGWSYFFRDNCRNVDYLHRRLNMEIRP